MHPTSPNLIWELEKYYYNLFKDNKYKYEWFQLSLKQYENIMNVSKNIFS